MSEQTKVIGRGYADGTVLGLDEVRELCREGFAKHVQPQGKSLLVIIPDGTRTVPLEVMFPLFHELTAGQAQQLDFLIALGTHQPMSPERIAERVGQTAESLARDYPHARIFNHRWDQPGDLPHIGRIAADRDRADHRRAVPRGRWTSRSTGMIFDYDHVMILGPVFPHEVVGFSGGNKYFFPGIARPGAAELLPLAGRGDHQPADHRDQVHARCAGGGPAPPGSSGCR